MKLLLALAALAASASAHYTFPQLVVGGTNTSAWQFVRRTTNWQSNNPVTDVTTTDIRCYTSGQSGTSSTMSVAAGSTVGFISNPGMFHQGVLNVYMAKAPTGTDVANWDGSGQVWFKIFQISAKTDGGTSISWPSMDLTQVNFQIPAATPSGQYLIRIEHIALHQAQTFQGAQFYLSCAQVQVTNGGNGTPGPLVAFPGAYTGNEPGILINIYFPIPATYTQPGPAVWTGGSVSGGGSPPATTVKTTSAPVTTVKTTSVPVTTVKTTTAPPATTTASNPSGGTVAQWGQCGGQGWTGPTLCATGFTCTQLNPFFFQCI